MLCTGKRPPKMISPVLLIGQESLQGPRRASNVATAATFKKQTTEINAIVASGRMARVVYDRMIAFPGGGSAMRAGDSKEKSYPRRRSLTWGEYKAPDSPTLDAFWNVPEEKRV
eukprot:m.118071 g.118071  ORF g.118071 m.118071 type:complete len:114 (+) comp37637_c1_seq10:191-532(+)